MKRLHIDRRQTAGFHLALNILYALGNAAAGLYYRSDWLLCAAAYYMILSVLRFSVIHYGKGQHDEAFMLRLTGILFLQLALILGATVFLTLKYEIGRKYHEIIMITMALYAFTKISLAIVNYLKCRRMQDAVMAVLRSIAFADGAVSIFSLQRSMLVSFGEMDVQHIRLFNLLTGTGVCLLVIWLGIRMIRYERKK